MYYSLCGDPLPSSISLVRDYYSKNNRVNKKAIRILKISLQAVLQATEVDGATHNAAILSVSFLSIPWHTAAQVCIELTSENTRT